jgi:hypothetical protein
MVAFVLWGVLTLLFWSKTLMPETRSAHPPIKLAYESDSKQIMNKQAGHHKQS